MRRRWRHTYYTYVDTKLRDIYEKSKAQAQAFGGVGVS
jgi:hypothetical protein